MQESPGLKFLCSSAELFEMKPWLEISAGKKTSYYFISEVLILRLFLQKKTPPPNKKIEGSYIVHKEKKNIAIIFPLKSVIPLMYLYKAVPPQL